MYDREECCCFFFFASRRQHTRSSTVSWARRCVEETDPTGLKCDRVRKTANEKKYVVANGDEGDPGAYMDRALMESDPHRILEGMAIAGYEVGADQGFLYVRCLLYTSDAADERFRGDLGGPRTFKKKKRQHERT